MTDAFKRPYNSPARRSQAAGTQQRIVAATRALFLSKGYAATTMADVAAAAAVSVQTVYSAAGGKAALAKRVWDVTVAGDLEAVPMNLRPQIQALMAEPDPVVAVHLYARLSRQVYERLGPLARVLRAGAVSDESLRQLIDTTEGERLTGTTALAAHLHSREALRADLTPTSAGQRLWALNGGEVADGLTLRCGWSLDEYEAWLGESMTLAVLRTP
jgi:AcrR family transcriptional regulator